MVLPFYITTPLGGSIRLDHIVYWHPLQFGDRVWSVNRIVLGFEGFHYMSMMDWMETDGINIDAASRTVRIEHPSGLHVVVPYSGEIYTLYIYVCLGGSRNKD